MHGKVYYLSERLSNKEFQGLNASKVSGIRVIKPPDILVDKYKDICGERALSLLSEIISSKQQSWKEWEG